jgi:hypothetical protein
MTQEVQQIIHVMEEIERMYGYTNKRSTIFIKISKK